jgi:hypothetical protein
MKCLVLIGFAGIQYSSAPGKEIDLPLSEAKSLSAQGIVKILEDYKPATAYETAKEAKQGYTTANKKARR